jgi:hypothetical protein
MPDEKWGKTPRPPAGCPLEAVYEHAPDGAYSVLSHGEERYGLISHSKYTNPTAMADTTTKCMNILPTVIVVFEAGNQRSI